MNTVSTLTHLKSLLLSVFDLIRSPETLPGNTLESFAEWTRNRRWLVIWLTLPALITTVVFLIAGSVAFFRNPSSVVQASLVSVDKKIPVDDLTLLAFEEHYIRNHVKKKPDRSIYIENTNIDGAGFGRTELVANEEFANSTKFRDCDLLLHRACRVSPESTKSRFRLALLSSLDTNLPAPQKTADEIMSKLAENKSEPFHEAHTWMAVTLYGEGNRRELTQLEKNQLDEHLKYAIRWRLIDPVLLTIYSAICLQAKKPERALQVAKQAAENRPELYLEYAQLCKRLGADQEKEMARAAKAAGEAFFAKLGTPFETEADRLSYAETLLLQGEKEKVIEILQMGLTDDPKEHQAIRRGLSNMYIEKFRTDNEAFLNYKNVVVSEKISQSNDASEKEKPDASPEINWQFLDKAAEVDPNNPFLGQEIAILWRKFTKPPPPALNKILYQQLKNDVASNGSRLMIAELCLVTGRNNDAKEQWEIILKKDPYVLQALNNLSVVLSRESPPQLARAMDLIDRAYRIQPFNSEMCDSYGEILMNASRPMEAIAKLEEAIRIEPTRLSTRKRLAACYRQLGMIEMADEQDNQVRHLEAVEAKKKELLNNANQ